MYASKLSQIILIITIILGFISSGSGKGIFAAKVDPVKTGTGLQTITSSPTIPKATAPAKKDGIKKTLVSCDDICKIEMLIKNGIRSEIANSIVLNCNALADNPTHCIKYASSIVKNESGGGYKCRKYNKYNCFGVQVKSEYKSYNDGVIHWIGKYNSKWYKAKDMSHFYSKAGTLPPTRYCTSELSSGTKVGCPHGLKISTSFYNKLTF